MVVACRITKEGFGHSAVAGATNCTGLSTGLTISVSSATAQLRCEAQQPMKRAFSGRCGLWGAYLKGVIGLEHAHREGAIGLGEPAVEFVGGMV